MKDTIVFCSLALLATRDVDAIAGTMRADKAMHTLFYSCGARALVPNVMFHHVLVDLVGFFPKERPIVVPSEQEPLVRRLISSM